jgi:hypothetical protein
MKKLLLLFGVVILSFNVFAQNKGDKYVMALMNASFKKVSSNSTEEPWSAYLGLGTGFGYFIDKNCRLELDLGVYYQNDPIELLNAAWLYDYYKGFTVCPNYSYYVKLAERFYYTPEIGVNLEFGTYSYEKNHSTTWDFPYKGFSIYANLLALSYRAGSHFALWVNVGDFGFSQMKYYDDESPVLMGQSLYFRLNSGSVGAHFYF